MTPTPPRKPRPPQQPSGPLPDRSLEAPADPPTVSVRSNGYHPFVFKKMLIGPTGEPPRDGDIVRIVDRDHIPLGFGLWNRRSQIPARFLSAESTPPGVDFWRTRVGEAVSLRRDLLGLDRVTNAYRAVHAEADGLTGLIVDRYDDVLSLEIFSLGIYQRIGPILELLSEALGTKHYLVKVDERIALAEDFSGRPIRSESLPPRVTAVENGVRFRISFDGVHKTGFFCDQRDNRARLAKYCADRSVLDMCCHSAGFGIYALTQGRAKDVTCVDLDEVAIESAKENANANQVRPTLVHADAFGYLRQMGVNGRRFGVVVLDPPKFIPSRLETSAGKRKYFDLNALALSLVEPGGILLSCSCSGLLPLSEFLEILRAAARKANRAVQVLEVTGAGLDHPIAIEAPEGHYLKAVWLRVGGRLPDRPFRPDTIEAEIQSETETALEEVAD